MWCCTYRLSGFLRGRPVTDDLVDAHAVAEQFVLLSGAIGLRRIREGLAARALSRSYKAASLWQEESAVAAISCERALTAAVVRCRAAGAIRLGGPMGRGG